MGNDSLNAVAEEAAADAKRAEEEATSATDMVNEQFGWSVRDASELALRLAWEMLWYGAFPSGTGDFRYYAPVNFDANVASSEVDSGARALRQQLASEVVLPRHRCVVFRVRQRIQLSSRATFPCLLISKS